MLLVEAKRAHPGVELDEQAFLAFVRARARGSWRRISPTWCSPSAAGRGDPVALRILERDYFHTSHDAQSLLPPRHRADATEVLQLLRHRLLVADAEGRVRIGEYSGRGSLRAWLRVGGGTRCPEPASLAETRATPLRKTASSPTAPPAISRSAT